MSLCKMILGTKQLKGGLLSHILAEGGWDVEACASPPKKSSYKEKEKERRQMIRVAPKQFIPFFFILLVRKFSRKCGGAKNLKTQFCALVRTLKQGRQNL